MTSDSGDETTWYPIVDDAYPPPRPQGPPCSWPSCSCPEVCHRSSYSPPGPVWDAEGAWAITRQLAEGTNQQSPNGREEVE